MRSTDAHADPKARRFTATTFLLVGGLLIWMADFLFVYVFAALACARRFAHLQLAGWPIVPVVNTFATLLALGATLLLVRVVLRHSDPQSDAHARFLRFVALATSGVAIVALIWLALPSLTVTLCDSGH